MVTGLAFVFVGVLVGVLSGLVGIGGGVAVVPILVFFFKMSQHQAQGTSVGMLLPPIGLLAVITYYRAGHVNITAALCLAAGFFVGGLAGARVAVGLSGAVLRRVFGVFLLLVSIYMIATPGRERPQTEPATPARVSSAP